MQSTESEPSCCMMAGMSAVSASGESGSASHSAPKYARNCSAFPLYSATITLEQYPASTVGSGGGCESSARSGWTSARSGARSASRTDGTSLASTSDATNGYLNCRLCVSSSAGISTTYEMSFASVSG